MNRSLPPLFRHLVLGGALLAATLVAFVPAPQEVRAAEPAAARHLILAQNSTKAAADTAARDASQAAKDAGSAAKDAAKEAASAAKAAVRDATAADADAEADSEDEAPQRHHKGLRIGMLKMDRQYDSFDQFLDRDPALASMVLGIVFIVFLTPILIIALIIWYKTRKNRMQNETMLRLAEKGIVPTAEAMQAIGTGRAAAAIGAVAATAPLVEQARALQKQSAWSDLRKGVLMGTAGIAITLFWLINDASASWFGLVLLFVGIGYVVLWYFEDQQATAMAAARAAQPVPAPGPGDRPN